MTGEEHLLQKLFPQGHEPPAEEDIFLRSREPSGRDIVVSIGGGMLVHGLVLLMVLALTPARPPREYGSSSISVNLVTPTIIEGGPGSAEGASRGPQGKMQNESSQSAPMDAEGETTPETAQGLLAAEEPPSPDKISDEPAELQAPEEPEPILEIDPPVARKAIPSTSTTKPKPKAKKKRASDHSASASPSPAARPSHQPNPPVTRNITGGPVGSDEIDTGEKTAGQRSSQGSRTEGAGGRSNTGSDTGSDGGSKSGAASGRTAFSLSQVDQHPQVLKKIEPVYPYMARCRKINGKVVIKLLVETDGSVSKVSVLEANPEGVFERSTLEAVRQWRFRAGCYKGKKVPTWIILPVQFKLDT